MLAFKIDNFVCKCCIFCFISLLYKSSNKQRVYVSIPNALIPNAQILTRSNSRLPLTLLTATPEGCILGPRLRGLDKNDDVFQSGLPYLELWPVRIDVVRETCFREKDVVSDNEVETREQLLLRNEHFPYCTVCEIQTWLVLGQLVSFGFLDRQEV